MNPNPIFVDGKGPALPCHYEQAGSACWPRLTRGVTGFKEDGRSQTEQLPYLLFLLIVPVYVTVAH